MRGESVNPTQNLTLQKLREVMRFTCQNGIPPCRNYRIKLAVSNRKREFPFWHNLNATQELPLCVLSFTFRICVGCSKTLLFNNVGLGFDGSHRGLLRHVLPQKLHQVTSGRSTTVFSTQFCVKPLRILTNFGSGPNFEPQFLIIER